MQSYLTGEWKDKEVVVRRPLAVMIPNNAQDMPQYGISEASIIYEAPVEGRIILKQDVLVKKQQQRLLRLLQLKQLARKKQLNKQVFYNQPRNFVQKNFPTSPPKGDWGTKTALLTAQKSAAIMQGLSLIHI